MPSDHRPHGAVSVEQRRLDEATSEALRAHGGLAENEYPISIVQIVETRGWDDDGREFADLRVYSTDGTTRRQVVSLLRDAVDVARGGCCG